MSNSPVAGVPTWRGGPRISSRKASGSLPAAWASSSGLEDEAERIALRRAQGPRRHAQRHERGLDQAVVDEPRRELVPRHARARREIIARAKADEVVAPGGELAVGAQARLQIMEPARPVEVVAQVVLPCPDEFDRPAGVTRDGRSLDHVVVVQSPSEAAAAAGDVDDHVRLIDPQRLGHQLAARLRRLGGGVEDDLAVLQLRRAVLRFERRVGDEGIAVGRLDHLGGLGQRRIRVAVLAHGLGSRLGRQRLGLFSEALGGLGGGRAFVPHDFQHFAGLVCAPPAVGDDGDAVQKALESRSALDDKGLAHALQRADLVEIGADHAPAIDRALLEHGVAHPRQDRVDAEDRFAADDFRAVDPAMRLADQTKVLGRLERDRCEVGGGESAGGRGEDAVADGPPAGRMNDDAGLGGAGGRFNPPARGGGADQQLASRRADFAHLVVVHVDGPAAARELRAELRRVRGRLLDPHLRPVGVQLLGDDQGQGGLDPLADLRVLRLKGDDAVRRDTDIGGELARRRGRRGGLGREAGADQQAPACCGADHQEQAAGRVGRRVGRGVRVEEGHDLQAFRVAATWWMAARMRL